MVDVRKCKYCGRFFETSTRSQKYCSDKCAKYAHNEARRHAREIANRDETCESTHVMHDERLQKYVAESIACGLSYGKYRMLKDFFHKTFEEIKNEYKDMSYLQ